MIIYFISNALTPHQAPFCDELAAIPGVSFCFIESTDIDKSSLPVGWRFLSNRGYVLSYASLQTNHSKVLKDVLNADVVIFGAGSISLIKDRLNTKKLTFIYSERIYKNWREILKYPYHLIKYRLLYGGSVNVRLLCASAFAAKDYSRLGLFKDKAYKWGYFPKVDFSFVPESFRNKKSDPFRTRIMWCSRFVKFKHPELPVKMAALLKRMGYSFELDMYGDGNELEATKKLVNKLHVDDVISFMGSQSNDVVLHAMRSHDIFLFTSDKNEGWGVVANEAMSNGCTLVASNEIGCVPFLVDDGVNGKLFVSRNLMSLTGSVKFLLDYPEKRELLSQNGARTIRKLWSPGIAADALYRLSVSIINNEPFFCAEGPCSKA